MRAVLALSSPAHGTVEANQEAAVFFKDVDMFVCAKLVENSPAIQSMRMLCETIGPFLLMEGRRATATDQKRRRIRMSIGKSSRSVDCVIKAKGNSRTRERRGQLFAGLLQPFKASSRNHPRVAGGNSRLDMNEKTFLPLISGDGRGPSNTKPTSTHNVSTHFQKIHIVKGAT